MNLSSTFRGGLCGLTLTLSFGVAHATDRFVPSQYPTIQAAIDASALGGDRVLVADGTYYEAAITFGGKNVKVLSMSGNPEACIVDAQRRGLVFNLSGGQSSETVVQGFTIRNGKWAFAGGGLWNSGQATVNNCIFVGNEAQQGGGMYNTGGTVTNCIFVGNSAYNGGGIDGIGIVTNCVFVGNKATIGGGIYSDAGKISNCIFFGNIAPTSPNLFTNVSILRHNLIGDLPSTPDANGNFGADPLFVRNPGTNGASDLGDLRLQWPSPAIDKGNNAAIAGFPTDLDGNARISRALVDLGAYEYQDLPIFIDAGPDQTVTVPHDGNPNTNTASVTLNAVAYDPEGAVVTFQWRGNNNIYPPNVNPTIALPAGVYTFTLTVTEPTGAVQTRTVKITVNPEPNGVPVVSDKNVSIKQGTSAIVDVTATDPDGDRLTYRLLSNSVNGTASLRGTTLTYTPNAGFLGTERIILGVQDGYGLEALLNVYVTVTDGIAPVITLNGSDPMTVAQGSTFTDPGATATDNVDGSVPVDVLGTVDTSTPGSYTLTYTATDAAGNSSTKTRTVNVADTAPPVITLNGSDPMTVAQGSTFVDPGATATDNVDGNVPVQVFGSVNTNTVGSYTLTYTATDAAGNSSSRTRTVNVVAPISSSKIVVSLKEIEGDDDCGRGRDGGEVEAEFVLRNTGTVPEDNVTITSVSLGGKSPKGRLPKRLGTIRAGRKEEAEFEFKGVRRGTYTLTLSGTSNKGSFSFSQTVTIR